MSRAKLANVSIATVSCDPPESRRQRAHVLSVMRAHSNPPHAEPPYLLAASTRRLSYATLLFEVKINDLRRMFPFTCAAQRPPVGLRGVNRAFGGYLSLRAESAAAR